MRVDFHCHSTASDGTLSPAEIAAAATEHSLAAFALTDHDNCRGAAELSAAGRGGASRFVPGVELSVEPGEGFDMFHLLGLGVDPSAPQLASLLGRILEGRRERNRRILGNFARIGIDIPPDELDRYANGGILARPHFARWLAEHGFAATAKEAFDKYLLPCSPSGTRCYEERWRPAQEDAFRAIRESGGTCVMAHPRYWRRAWRTAGIDYAAAEKELSRLKEAGLDGIEAFYQANTFGENMEFVRIADRLGLVKSAGSDFHGSNKPGISLGMKVSRRFAAPLFERLGIPLPA